MRKPDSELIEANRITLPGQRLNNLNKWLTRAMSSLVGARVVCLGLGTHMNINNLDVVSSRIGNVGRGVAARLAIDRRGVCLRWIEAVRCGVALSVNVDGLCL